MMSPIDFEVLTARALVEGLGSNQWTSVQLTRYFLNRIHELDVKVHAVPFVFEKEALFQAQESDARRAAGKPLSRLDGLPMTLKDAVRVKGLLSTYGMWIFRNHRPKEDCQLIDVLRKAGIVFLGRTAVPTGAFDWNCRNSLYSECVNPLDSARIPGGSSGGAAAALVMGMTPLELGSDLGGSIRYPAHCCGIYGLRTTDGWLPIQDVGPEGFGAAFRQLATFGPMSKTLEDLDLLLETYADRFPGLLKPQNGPIDTPLRIAYSNDLLGRVAEPSTQSLFNRFLDRLGKLGHNLVETQPDFDFEELYRDWGLIAGYEYASALPGVIRYTSLKRIYARWILDYRLGAGPLTTYFKKGMFAREIDYQRACERKNANFEAVDRFFQNYALWMLPVAPSSAILRSECGKMIQTSYDKVEYSKYLGSYTVPTTMLGTPVLTYPIGLDDIKMPVGIQIHGPRFSDRWLVHLAGRL